MRVFTRFPFVVLVANFEFAGFQKKYTAYDRFHGYGPYGEIPTKEELIRAFGFTLNTKRSYKRQGHATFEALCWVFFEQWFKAEITVSKHVAFSSLKQSNFRRII